ncbi:MAG: hypothetical protein ACI93T_003466, partial [Porticoccaceae bacterium]
DLQSISYPEIHFIRPGQLSHPHPMAAEGSSQAERFH